jgi:hypothetical protein
VREAARRAYRRPVKRARSGEVISALSDMAAATGDDRFLAALAAMTEHGFDQPNAGTWKIRERREKRVLVKWMHDRRARKKMSIQQAAEMAVERFGFVDGENLDDAVRRLVRAYREARPALEAGLFAACSQRLGRE